MRSLLAFLWRFLTNCEDLFADDLDQGTDWLVGSSIKSTLQIACDLWIKLSTLPNTWQLEHDPMNERTDQNEQPTNIYTYTFRDQRCSVQGHAPANLESWRAPYL